ncbi:FUSC family protein [Hyalangium gracile]|uniref:FUSC family protein n=1 Tax=Hyalangium gracile TaxID=394092 RepID=UPI001CCDF9B2|nr:FUSC family protein [Hyalangium gracile]
MAAVCLGTLAAVSLAVSAVVFLVVIFLAVSAQRFGPRGLALGMIAFMTLFLSLFFHAPVAQLPWVAASVVVAGVTSYHGVRLWLVPDRSVRTLRRTFAAFRRSITLLLADLSDALEVSSERRRTRLFQRAVWRVNEAALAVEQQSERARPAVLAQGLRPAEDILLRAWHRFLGSVIGVVAGVVLASAVSGHRHLEFVLIFLRVFLGFYLIRVSYAWMVFWFTALLSVLYSLLGRYSSDLLFLRVEETAIGAFIGGVVAVVLLPSRTSPRVQRAAVETLHSVASFLEAPAVLPGRVAVERRGRAPSSRSTSRPSLAGAQR